MKIVGRNAVALGSVESQPSQSAREVALVTCPAEYSGAQVSAQKTGANPSTSSGQALGHRHNYVNLNIGLKLALGQAVAYFVQWTIVGIVIGLICKPLATP